MSSLHSFNGMLVRGNVYGGSDEKLVGLIDDAWYMLKYGETLEPDPKNPLQASYESAPVSEHIGCRIFQEIGIPAQETILGELDGRSVVACKDFVRARGDVQLVEFSMVENSTPGVSSTNRRTPEYNFTLKVLHENPMLEPIREAAIERFWQTLCIDGLIGNFDRHAGNWGYLADSNTLELVDLAPVYDCGSCLYPRLSEDAMQDMLAQPERLVERVKTFPTVRLEIDGKRPRYHEFLMSDLGCDARKALLDVWDNINMERIAGIVDDVPSLSETKRRFFKEMLSTRLEVILKPAYRLALSERGVVAAEFSAAKSQSLSATKEAAVSFAKKVSAGIEPSSARAAHL